MQPEHVLYITLRFDDKDASFLSKGFIDRGFILQRVGTERQVYKRLSAFDAKSWEREVIEAIEPLLVKCKPLEMYVEHSDGSITRSAKFFS